MKILTAPIKRTLLANGEANQKMNMVYAGTKQIDHKPVLKLFGGSACTWLFTELDQDGDTLFGLTDIGHGEVELGYVSLRELLALKFPPFGLPIERDRWFSADKTLSQYHDEAKKAGRIIA